jgi:DnaJ-class molecular chaperone with C-terminal Zn finger domain
MGYDVDFYAILGVRRDAAAEEIARAYAGRMAEAEAPDMDAQQRYSLQYWSAAAYAVLSDANRRAAYDANGYDPAFRWEETAARDATETSSPGEGSGNAAQTSPSPETAAEQSARQGLSLTEEERARALAAASGNFSRDLFVQEDKPDPGGKVSLFVAIFVLLLLGIAIFLFDTVLRELIAIVTDPISIVLLILSAVLLRLSVRLGGERNGFFNSRIFYGILITLIGTFLIQGDVLMAKSLLPIAVRITVCGLALYFGIADLRRRRR